MSISPRTQQMQQAAGAGPDQAAQQFERGFSDLAYNVLLSKLPDVVQDVVTFKVLQTNLDEGSGVGAFVVLRNNQPLYIPVVMVNSAIKPLELVYSKSLNIFLPLTQAWLNELDKTSVSSLGEGVKTPETLYTDVDIRNVMVPPITGRFSYAAWEPVILADVARVLDKNTIEKTAAEPQMVLLHFLNRAPNSVKLAFAKVLKKSPEVMKYAAATYGIDALVDSLRLNAEKVAFDKVAAKQQYGGALWIADKDTTPTEFRRIFGDQAGEAYAGVRRKGFAAKDERLHHNTAMLEQPYAQWTEPRQPGVYVIYGTDGKEMPAFVTPSAVDIFGKATEYGKRPAKPGHTPGQDRTYPIGRPSQHQPYHTQPQFLAVLANGDYIQTEKLVGSPSVADEISGGPLHERLFKDVAGSPKVGLGFFVRQHGSTFQATVPLRIVSISNDSDGTRRIKATNAAGWDTKQLMTQPRSPYGDVKVLKDSDLVYIPNDYVWVPLKEKREARTVHGSAHDVAACASYALNAVGARKVSIKNASAGQFSIDGQRAVDRVAALRKVAQDFELPVDSVDSLLTKAAADRRVDFWVASLTKLAQAQLLLDKRAADDSGSKKKPPKKDTAPSGAEDPGMEDPGMDPSMMDPSMMQPPAPPPPSPSDLAAMEMQQQIEHEMQKLQEKAQMLASLTQRTQEIAGGAPVLPTVQTQAMGAPPPSMNMATGAPMAGAAPGGPPGGMDPSMMGGPPAGPAPGGMDPSMMGGPAPGGALPPGADPSMDPSMMGGPPPPTAMMGPDGPSANDLEQEVNPQFLQQAAQLQSGDIFDAAAVSSLAQSSAVKELVGQYVPNLEKALDNLGRVLMSLWMQETHLKEELGEETYTGLEDNLRTTLKNLGDLVLKLSQGAHAISNQAEHGVA
jgi:hypothetical protein